MRRPLSLLFRGLAAFALLAPVSLITTLPAAAAPLAPAGACSTGVGNGGGRGIICRVTIANTFTATGGSAVVTVYECLGSAGDPTDGVGGHACTTTTTSKGAPVTSVSQCNFSVNGGGATLRCSVVITNSFVGISPGSTPVTVDQCIGSGAGGIPGDGVTGNTIHCDPIQSTTSAAVTQCNRSANGLTLVHLNCTVTGTSMASSAAHRVTIAQCNDSTNQGGALVECSASMVNRAGGVGGTTPPGGGTPPPTSTSSDGSSSNSTPLLPLMILLALGGFAAAAVVTQRRNIRS